MLVAHGVRAGGDRQVAARARARAPGRRSPAGTRCGADRPGTATPARTARSRNTWRRSPASTTATTPPAAIGEAPREGRRAGGRGRSGRGRRRRRDPGRVARRERPRGSRDAVLLGAALRRGGRAGAPDDAGVRGHPLRRPEPARPGRVPRVARAGRAAADGRDVSARSCSPPGRRGAAVCSPSSTVSLGPLSDEDAVELTGKLFEQRGLDELADRADVARGFERREPAVHRGAHRVARRAIDAGREPAPGQHPRHRRRAAGRAARARARRRARRLGRRQGVLARGARAAAPGSRSGPRRAARVARAARPHPPRGARRGSRATSSSASSTG